MTKIEIKNIKKSFGKNQTEIEVLRGINAEIESGKMTFLVGPSGCGKTTLISIIAGILTPKEGEIILFGKNINKLTASQNARFRRQNIGFVFQQFNLLPSLTALENVSVPLIINKVSRKIAEEKSFEMLKKVGLESSAKKLPKELSGGQQQRIAIARSLIHNPKLLICDEPTSSLDSASGLQIINLLKECANEKDRCVIVVTHDDRIFKFADVILKMNDGKIENKLFN